MKKTPVQMSYSYLSLTNATEMSARTKTAKINVIAIFRFLASGGRIIDVLQSLEVAPCPQPVYL
jgi:hypothetical protein